jgi:hypothetical protein
MPNKQVKQILVGVGNLYLEGEYDAAGNFTPQPAAERDLGFTIDGVEITLEPDIVDINVDQLGDAAKLVLNHTKVMLKTTLAEATLANLALAWGYPKSAVSGNTFNVGVFATGKPTEKKLTFVGKNADGFDRTYTVHRVVSVAAVGHSYKRGEATVFPVEFRVLPDASHTGAEYGTIVDATS